VKLLSSLVCSPPTPEISALLCGREGKMTWRERQRKLVKEEEAIWRTAPKLDLAIAGGDETSRACRALAFVGQLQHLVREEV